MKTRMIISSLLLTMCLFITACGQIPTFAPIVQDAATVLKNNGFTQVLESSCLDRCYEDQSTAVEAEIVGNNLHLVRTLALGFGEPHRNGLIQVKTVLATLYPAELVSVIEAAMNKPTTTIMYQYHGKIGSYGWYVGGVYDQLNPSNNKEQVSVEICVTGDDNWICK